MTNTSTQDTEACVEQAKRVVDAGGEYVMPTTQGIKDVREPDEYQHWATQPGIYGTTCRRCTFQIPKVVDGQHNMPKSTYQSGKLCRSGTYLQAIGIYGWGHTRITENPWSLHSFSGVCKENHTAICIGVNHGSLSDCIMSVMVIPRKVWWNHVWSSAYLYRWKFKDVVISIKASNTVVMVKTVRLLVKAVMEKEGMAFHI